MYRRKPLYDAIEQDTHISQLILSFAEILEFIFHIYLLCMHTCDLKRLRKRYPMYCNLSIALLMNFCTPCTANVFAPFLVIVTFEYPRNSRIPFITLISSVIFDIALLYCVWNVFGLIQCATNQFISF